MRTVRRKLAIESAATGLLPGEQASESASSGERLLTTMPEVAELRSTPRPPGILVVDDCRATRVALEYALEMCGYDVLLAATPSEALALARHKHIDLLLTDVHLPEASGYSLASQVLQLWPKCRRIFMSANAELPADMAGVLVEKPIGLDALLDVVEQQLALAPPEQPEKRMA